MGCVLHYTPALGLARALPSTRFVAPPVSLLRFIASAVVLEFLPVFHRLRPYVLALGPDLPWVDEPSPGNLRFSAAWFLTRLSLLIPAFSLVCTPRLLPLTLLRAYIAPLPLALIVQILNFGEWLQPRLSSAQNHSTSELLRTLSMSGCF